MKMINVLQKLDELAKQQPANEDIQRAIESTKKMSKLEEHIAVIEEHVVEGKIDDLKDKREAERREKGEKDEAGKVRQVKGTRYGGSKQKDDDKDIDESIVSEKKQAKNPYAIGMAKAKEITGDEPPLKKSTIKKAHEIAKKIDEDESMDVHVYADGKEVKSFANRKLAQAFIDHHKKNNKQFADKKLTIKESVVAEDWGTKKNPWWFRVLKKVAPMAAELLVLSDSQEIIYTAMLDKLDRRYEALMALQDAIRKNTEIPKLEMEIAGHKNKQKVAQDRKDYEEAKIHSRNAKIAAKQVKNIVAGLHKEVIQNAQKQAVAEGKKPDFLDIDKDGNKKEPMKKAAKDAKKKTMKESDTGDAPISKMSDAELADYTGMSIAAVRKDREHAEEVARDKSEDVKEGINESKNINSILYLAGVKKKLNESVDYAQEDQSPASGIPFNGKMVDAQSIVVTGVDTKDYPDLVDAYIESAEYTDGTPLSDEELNQFQDENNDLVHQLAHDSLHETTPNATLPPQQQKEIDTEVDRATAGITDPAKVKAAADAAAAKARAKLGVGVDSSTLKPTVGIPVAEDVNMSITANSEQDVMSMVRKLAGIPSMATVSMQPAATADETTSPCAAGMEDVQEADGERIYDNSPHEQVSDLKAVIASGNDMHKMKGTYPKVAGGDNPMQAEEDLEESLWKKYKGV